MTGKAAGGGAVFRIAASAALILYLTLAAGNGLDRLSVFEPTLERLVPGPLRAQADRSAAAIALARGDSAAALVFAAHAVRRDPVDPLSDSLLGSALQFAGDTQKAEAAFRVSAARGWRDRLTQLYWYGAALQAGDAELAALRVDALLRTGSGLGDGGVLLDPLEADPKGRAAVASRLAENPAWAPGYLSVWGEVTDEKLRLKAGIATLAARGGKLGCEVPRAFVVSLIDRGLRRDAQQLWQAACPRLAGSSIDGLSDVGFGGLAEGGETAPFGWRRHARGDVFIESVEGGVALRNSASVSRVVLTQAVALAPGAYRVRIKASGRPGQLAVSFDCGSQAKRPAQLRGDAAEEGQLVDVGACDSQVLGIWLRPGGDVALDSIALEPAR